MLFKVLAFLGLQKYFISESFRDFMSLIVIENLLTSKSYDFDSRQNSLNFEVFEMLKNPSTPHYLAQGS